MHCTRRDAISFLLAAPALVGGEPAPLLAGPAANYLGVTFVTH